MEKIDGILVLVKLRAEVVKEGCDIERPGRELMKEEKKKGKRIKRNQKTRALLKPCEDVNS